MPENRIVANGLSRRSLLRTAVSMPLTSRVLAAQGSSTVVAGSTLDPRTIPKYVTRLAALPAMPMWSSYGGVDYYLIGIRQFSQQVLPLNLPKTVVWGYGSPRSPATFHSPACTIEARVGRPVQVMWANQLVDGSGRFLPHLLPVDPTLHWANPPGGRQGRDSHPTFASTPGPYTGPVPVVTHLHGAHVTEESDGYPESWYLPPAWDIPGGYARVGSSHDRHRAMAADQFGAEWSPGTAVYRYANDQSAGTLWFHDHTLGMSRLNVHAGLAGFYLLRGGARDLPPGVLPGPAPGADDRPGIRYHELSLVVQDRSFNRDGSIFFPDGRAFSGDVPPAGPFVPASDIPPIWNPDTFGNTMVVNGRTWPVLSVEPRRYRFRLLNACNARTLLLKIVANPLAPRPAPAALPCWQIGADGGFLPRPVQTDQLLCAPAERVDVIVDFTSLPAGTELFLINEGPDGMFMGGSPGKGLTPADPATTGQVMKFVVTQQSTRDTSVPPAQLSLPRLPSLGQSRRTWRISLTERHSTANPAAAVSYLLGTVAADGTPKPLTWADDVTERPALRTTETWELANFTGEAHPIHLHQVQFRVTGRQPLAGGGPGRGPESGETGVKDTVIAYPNEITRIDARFDISGRYVMHCHILDHEDNEMMRPIQPGG
ncbi:laccase [Kutzneria sp. CA-103260]|nr:laccase [Kutzneria sp. CA-103260]